MKQEQGKKKTKAPKRSFGRRNRSMLRYGTTQHPSRNPRHKAFVPKGAFVLANGLWTHSVGPVKGTVSFHPQRGYQRRLPKSDADLHETQLALDEAEALRKARNESRVRWHETQLEKRREKRRRQRQRRKLRKRINTLLDHSENTSARMLAELFAYAMETL